MWGGASGGSVDGAGASWVAAHEETEEEAEMEGDTGDIGIGTDVGDRGRGKGEDTRRLSWGRGGVRLTRLMVVTACR